MFKIDSSRPLQVLLLGFSPEEDCRLREVFSRIIGQKYLFESLSGFQESLRAVRKNGQDVALLPRTLGDGNALDFLQEVRASGSTLPIIVVNGEGERDFALQAMGFGASDHLDRAELTPNALERSIQYALCREHVSREIKDQQLEMAIHDRLAAIGMLASGVAHEIGTPLGVIRGRAENLILTGKGGSSRDLQVVIEQVDRISGLMRSLLNLARGDDTSGGASVDLRAVIEDVLKLLSRVFETNQIVCEAEFLVKGEVRAVADSGPFQQVILNILQNSIQAIASLQGAAKARSHRIGIRVRDWEGYWEIQVKDTGVGIKPEDQKQLFRPFFTTKGVGGGTGLSLALGYRMIRAWNGSLQVMSRKGEGAEVLIRLPKAGSASAPPV